MTADFDWTGRRVLVTGHTGFKGAWLVLWLKALGADVHGFALDPESPQGVFQAADVARALSSDARADIRDRTLLTAAFERIEPEFVFHLAAQSLVRRSYSEPMETFGVNLMGTVHLLDALRHAPSVRAALIVTTDKCYDNRERPEAYRESDALGGHDPYSASKACAEIATAAFRASYFHNKSGRSLAVASARAGNVIGGGDWAEGRLVPDCIRAFMSAKPVQLRYAKSLRPWLYVLEPLRGYLTLAERLLGPEGGRFADAFNFGPRAATDANVETVARSVAALWGAGAAVTFDTSAHPHEAGILRLDAAKAERQLGWSARLSLEEGLDRTVAWYRTWLDGKDMHAFSLSQIAAYEGLRAHDRAAPGVLSA